MSTQTCSKSLDNVEYFIHSKDMLKPLDIYTVSIGKEIPVCLKFHNLSVILVSRSHNHYLKKIRDIKTEVRYLEPYLDWKMNVQECISLLDTQEQLENILKDTSAVFGVWGETQLDFFRQYVGNVVDVAPLVMQKVLEFEQEKDNVVKPYERCLLLPNLTIGELFLYILRKHSASYPYLATDKRSRKAFEEFIETFAWTSFLCTDY